MATENPILLILTLRCDQAAALASASYDRPMSRPERVALAMHRLICGPCRRLRRQLDLLRRAMGRLADGLDPIAAPATDLASLPQADRDRIARALDDELRRG